MHVRIASRRVEAHMSAFELSINVADLSAVSDPVHNPTMICARGSLRRSRRTA
jgi:hypothetical protein